MKVLVISGTPDLEGQTRVVQKYLLKLFADKYPDLTVSGFDLAEIKVPLYGYPMTEAEKAIADDWIAQVTEADAYVITTPEYHSNVSGAIKNAFDHLPVRSMADKFAAVVTVGGRYGGAHASASAFAMLRGLRCWSVPSPVCIPLEEKSAAKSLLNPINIDRLNFVMDRLVTVAKAVRG